MKPKSIILGHKPMRKQTKATFPFIELHGSKNRWLCVVKLSHIGLCLSKRTKKSGILRIEKFNIKHNGMKNRVDIC